MKPTKRPKADYSDYGDLPPYMGQGSAHAVSSEPPDRDVIEDLYNAVQEATGKDMRPPRRGIGFTA